MRSLILAGLALLVGGCGKAAPTVAHGKPVSHWVQALQDPDPRVRKKAVEILGNVGTVDPAAISSLTRTVKDRDSKVRREAIQALLRVGPSAEEAIPVLREAQKDQDPVVRYYATRALEKVRVAE